MIVEAAPVKLVLALPGFFKIPPQTLKVETGPVSGLVYFLKDGRVVAIAEAEKSR